MISLSTSLTITHTIKHDQHFIILVCKASYGKVNNIINIIIQKKCYFTILNRKYIIPYQNINIQKVIQLFLFQVCDN